MIKVYPGLHVGSAEDYEGTVRGQQDWRVVQACKEPYHRVALEYLTAAAPKDHPEYLYAFRDNRLILNLVDAPNPKLYSAEIMDVALNFISDALGDSHPVLVHCNLGMSRGPGIALLYLASRQRAIPAESYALARSAFIKLYPPYSPSRGMEGFLIQNWEGFCS